MPLSLLSTHLTFALALVGMLCVAGLRLVFKLAFKTAKLGLLVAAPLALYMLYAH